MFVVVKIKISKIREMRFYLIFGFHGFKLLRNQQWIFSKVAKISDFRILSGWTEKHKLALVKSNFLRDNLYCAILVIISLNVNIVKGALMQT